MNKSEFLELLKRLTRDAIIRGIISNDGVYHARHINVDRFIAAIDAELMKIREEEIAP